MVVEKYLSKIYALILSSIPIPLSEKRIINSFSSLYAVHLIIFLFLSLFFNARRELLIKLLKISLKNVSLCTTINDSGLVNTVNYNDTGLLEVKAFISGSINNLSKSISNYRQSRTNYNKCVSYGINKYKKKYCKKYYKYYISCKKANYNNQYLQ